MHLQSVYHIIESLVSAIPALNVDSFTKFLLKGFFTLFPHLGFVVFFFFMVELFAVVAITDGVIQSIATTLCSEIFGHIIKVAFTSSECLTGVTIAVTDYEMCVDMLGIYMYSEHHIKAFAMKVFVCKLLSYLKRLFVGKPVIIFGAE